MILAQNHLLQLNGNRIGIGLLLSMVFWGISCSPSKKTTRLPSTPKEKVENKNTRQKGENVDTIVWQEIPETVAEPITDDGLPRENKIDNYTITVILPFKTEDTDQPYNERFVHFYGGIQMALDELRARGLDISMKTFDSQGKATVIQNKLNLPGLNAHLIIGPYNRECLQEAAKWAKENKVPLVSPWIASQRITNNNPYYIQLRPSIKDHYNTMIDDILSSYEADQVIILKQESGEDDNKVKYLQQYAAAVLNQEGTQPFREVGIEKDSLILGETYLSDLFDEDRKTVFISQNYLFDEDEFVYNCLRKLSAAKGDREAVVYAMPLVIDIEKVDYNIYKLLNLHVIRSRFVDPYDEGVNEFRRAYYHRFSAIPVDEAYYGYDIGFFFGELLEKYGQNFQLFIDQEEDLKLLQTRFDIQKTFEEDKFSDDYRDINYFSNKFLDVIKFEEDRFLRKRKE